MTVLAITGHLDLTPASVPLVREALRVLLDRAASDPLTGVSCLAEGADALFAAEILTRGGRLEAVLPSRDYRVGRDCAAEFDRLLGAAASVTVLQYERATPAAYAAANQELLRRADLLIAVWDGRPGRGPGGTADMVAAARAAGLPVEVVWPPGAARLGGLLDI